MFGFLGDFILSKEITSLSDLTPDDKNANSGTERGAYMVERSLELYGAGRSILADKNGKVIAGNKTLQGAAHIGMEDVIVVKTTGKQLVVVQREDLDLETDAAAKELGVVDNRASEVGLEWDPEVLTDLQDEGADLTAFFFNDELAAIFEAAEEEIILPYEETEASHTENPNLDRARERSQTDPESEADETVSMRFVQLFLEAAQHEEFMQVLKRLSKQLGTSTISDTVYKVVINAGNQAAGEDQS